MRSDGRGRGVLCLRRAGHGEPDFEDRETVNGYALAKEAIENENYAIEPLLLPSVESVPESCSILIINGPTRPLLDHEIEALDRFVRAGGSILALLAPRRSQRIGQRPLVLAGEHVAGGREVEGLRAGPGGGPPRCARSALRPAG